jgi:hypothetical protein
VHDELVLQAARPRRPLPCGRLLERVVPDDVVRGVAGGAAVEVAEEGRQGAAPRLPVRRRVRTGTAPPLVRGSEGRPTVSDGREALRPRRPRAPRAAPRP